MWKNWSAKNWQLWQIKSHLPFYIPTASSYTLYKQLIHQYFTLQLVQVYPFKNIIPLQNFPTYLHTIPKQESRKDLLLVSLHTSWLSDNYYILMTSAIACININKERNMKDMWFIMLPNYFHDILYSCINSSETKFCD